MPKTMSNSPPESSRNSSDDMKIYTGRRHAHRRQELKKNARYIIPRSQVKKYVNQGGGYIAGGDLVKLVNNRLKKRTKEFQRYLAILCQYTKRKKIDTDMIQLAYYYYAKGPMMSGSVWGQYEFHHKKKPAALVCDE